jgi:thioredoxin-like negative regulator of GroEL
VVEGLECTDLVETGIEAEQGLMQLEKTQKIWDYKNIDTKFLGPADNALSHLVQGGIPVDVHSLDSQSFQDFSKQGNWQALYFHAPWCKYCSCLDPVWSGVAKNLVGSLRQPKLVISSVDGDSNTELRNLFNVTVYPTFVVVNKDGSKVLGRYLGPRKVFELSNWIEDLIVADENPIVKHQFEPSEAGAVNDLHPVYPYTGPKAFGDQTLASLEASIGLTGNEFDECVDSDEAKFTSPGVALLVHYASSTSVHALEMDIQTVSTHAIPNKPTVVDFMAPWCPHCQRLNPVWDNLSAEFASGSEVVIGKVDTEAHPDVKNEFGIHRFPTIMYFEAGQPMKYDEGHRYTGQRDPESLKKWIHDVVIKH